MPWWPSCRTSKGRGATPSAALHDLQGRSRNRPKPGMFRKMLTNSGLFWLSWDVSELPGQPGREAIAADLTTVARQGLKARRLHLKLGSLGGLGQLARVESRPPEQRAEAICELVTEAVGSLPPGAPRDALEALLGMGTTAEMPHASRRSAEMQALGLDPTVTSEHSFRKTREKELLWDLAGAIADIEARHRQATAAAEAPGPGTGTGTPRRGRRRVAVGISAFFVVAGVVLASLALLAWRTAHTPRS